MIKFFRRIRQRLLTEGKLSQYLFYAIGEIILVVIGILIALQINNWNEHNKKVEASRAFLMEFRKDLVSDTVSFTTGIRYIENKIMSEEWALARTSYSSSDLDALMPLINETYSYREMNFRTFRMVQNSGNSKLTGFDELFDELSSYYGKSSERLKTFIKWDQRVVTEEHDYLRALYGKIEKDNKSINSVALLDEEPTFPMMTDPEDRTKIVLDFVTSIRGRNHIKENYARHVRLRRIYREVKDEARDLIMTIDELIKIEEG